ncbi:MAG: aminotransferase [Proteobacteria bacterium]|nr:aminotransferase [Pseudomonadota bacterium]MBI3498943.1 aminotransferase [Pseudomonadota bacterium]
MKPANSVLSSYGTSVFEVMSRLAIEHRSVNLGQGFPDGMDPSDVVEAAAEALRRHPNQYPPMLGVPELRQAVAQHEKRFHGMDFDWQSEIMVTSGATEALASALFGLIEPGDEVVLIEPLYDSYAPIIRRAGGVPRSVRVTPPDWRLPRQELERAFGAKTKLILLNNPLNPAAKVFTLDELRFIAELVVRHDCYAVCDEVYEHIVFDRHRFHPLIAMPGMRERTVRIGSAGKTFSLTGWKVGYVSAAPALIRAVSKTHQFLVFTTPPNLQRAVAYGLAKGDDYYESLRGAMQAKRDRFAEGLARIGFALLECEGTYFVIADFRPLGFKGDDEAFCRYITVEAGVTAVPVGAFYLGEPAPRAYVRFCFCKRDEVLDEALARLERHFAGPAARRA